VSELRDLVLAALFEEDFFARETHGSLSAVPEERFGATEEVGPDGSLNTTLVLSASTARVALVSKSWKKDQREHVRTALTGKFPRFWTRTVERGMDMMQLAAYLPEILSGVGMTLEGMEQHLSQTTQQWHYLNLVAGAGPEPVAVGFHRQRHLMCVQVLRERVDGGHTLTVNYNVVDPLVNGW